MLVNKLGVSECHCNARMQEEAEPYFPNEPWLHCWILSQNTSKQEKWVAMDKQTVLQPNNEMLLINNNVYKISYI